MIAKRIAGMLAVFVIASTVCVVSILCSPFLMQLTLKFLIQKNLKGYSVDELTVGRQQWIFPGDLQLSHVVLKVSSKDVRWSIQVLSLRGRNIHRILFAQAKVPVQMKGIDISKGPIVVSEANTQCEFDFLNRSLTTWRADIVTDHLQVQKYQMTRVSAQINGTKQNIRIKDFDADLYEGHMQADLNLQLLKPIRYQVLARLTGINVDLLRGVNDVLYDQIQGIMDAEVSLDGHGNHLQINSIAVNMTKNAQIRASLLKFVTPYIPPTQNLSEFEELIRKDLKVPVEKADLSLQSVADQKLVGAIHLGVQKINLDLNLPIDILFDGSLINLMQWYQRFIH